MEMKRKILAIGIILMLVSISFNIVQAFETKENNLNNEPITIEIGVINNEVNSIIQTMSLSEDELNELEIILSDIIKKIESSKSWEEIDIILDNYLQKQGFIIDLVKNFINMIKNVINGIIFKTKSYFSKGLVLSFGRGYNFKIFKKTDLIDTKKAFYSWHYSKGTTLIVKRDFRDMKILKGLQFGFMLNFKGIYMHINHIFRKDFTFFFGMSQMVNGIQFLKRK